MEWLYEGRSTVYVILGACAVVLLALWARDGFVFFKSIPPRKGEKAARRRPAVLPLLVLLVAVLVGVYALLSVLVETRNKQIERKVKEMAAAVKRKDADAIMKHVSPSFQIGSMKREQFQEYVQSALRRGMVDELHVWEFVFSSDQPKVRFKAKPKGGWTRDTEYFLVEAEFVKDSDGQWRMKAFEVYNPFVDTNKPLGIPWPR